MSIETILELTENMICGSEYQLHSYQRLGIISIIISGRRLIDVSEIDNRLPCCVAGRWDPKVYRS
jgi:hypothetical protein